MIRMSKLTDYGVILMTCFARDAARAVRTSRELSVHARLAPPTVSKLLKQLARAELLVSHRGAKGGYRLARAPESVTLKDVITALEGPIALSDCTDAEPGRCRLERRCPVRANWREINRAVNDALAALTLADLVPRPPGAAAAPLGATTRGKHP